MESNPYQPPVMVSKSEGVPERTQSFPIGLVALCILASLQIVVAGLLVLGGLVMENGMVVGGGFVSFGFHLAILVGLCLRRDWARVMLIWLCYVGIVSYGAQCGSAPWIMLPLVGLEVLTLLFAHSRTVRNATRQASLAKAYVYRENASTEREKPQHEDSH